MHFFYMLDKYTVRRLKLYLAVVLCVAAWCATFPAAQTVFQTAHGKKKLPIYGVVTPEKKIAITFNAAWGDEDTDELLSILATYNAKCTFFVCGYWVVRFPQSVQKIFDAGHEIANHGDSHAHVAQYDMAQNQREILGTHEKVKALLGIDMTLYRPPYGEYNDIVLDAAKSVGYQTIQWTVDSLDWMKKGVTAEIAQVMEHKNMSNGAIVLFHNDAPYTPAALKTILSRLQEQEYQFVTVSDLILKNNFELNHEGRQVPLPSETKEPSQTDMAPASAEPLPTQIPTPSPMPIPTPTPPKKEFIFDILGFEVY